MLTELYPEYKDRLNLVAIGIDPTDDEETMRKILPHMERITGGLLILAGLYVIYYQTALLYKMYSKIMLR